MITLDLAPLEKAINSLNSILKRYERENHDIDIRDAVIQRFEYTFSLAVRMLSRYISIQKPDMLNEMTFNEIIRQSNKFGLLKNNLEKWTDYRQKRNLTLHTYDENIAKEVVAIIPEFKEEAEFLLDELKKSL